jgi:pimeloyl-ACP methyl ester carboxylesterase
MRERRVRVGDLEVAVEESGAGPPVVLVHGGLGSRRLWAPQVEALRDSYRVIAYDLRGHGDTRGATRPASYGPRLLAADLEGLLDALGLDAVTVVGLSVGGFVAQELALSRPERVEALVLADTWARTGMRRSERLIGRGLSPLVVAGLTLLGTGALARVTGTHLEPELRRERELMVRAVANTDRRDAVRIWRGLAEHDTIARLGQVRVPTLVIAGDRDRNMDQAALMHRLIPGSELTVLPGAGHASNLHRAQLFNAALRPFLDRVHSDGQRRSR